MGSGILLTLLPTALCPWGVVVPGQLLPFTDPVVFQEDTGAGPPPTVPQEPPSPAQTPTPQRGHCPPLHVQGHLEREREEASQTQSWALRLRSESPPLSACSFLNLLVVKAQRLQTNENATATKWDRGTQPSRIWYLTSLQVWVPGNR